MTVHETQYPYSWLGILSKTKPAHDELIYASHERGFALASMRNENLSRYYLQTTNHENISDWPDEKIWRSVNFRNYIAFDDFLQRGQDILPKS